MRILVTGGTGFLGRHLVRALQSRQINVRVLGRNEKACEQLREAGVEVIRADLEDASTVREACEHVDVVFHVAALSSPWGRRRDFYRTNVVGTEHVLAGCRAHRVSRFIHISSPSVVFEGRDLVQSTEKAAYARRFLCYYSESKKLGEDHVQEAHRQGLATTILRPKAVFGPGDTTLLPRLVDAARRGRLPQIGDGTNRIDLTYVDNVVHAMILAIDAPASVGNIYTITNGEPVLLWELIQQILDRLGIDSRLRRLPYGLVRAIAGLMELRAWIFGGEPVLTRYTTAILARTQTYDIAAARRDLGYEPIVSLADGVERALVDMQERITYG